MVDGAEFWINCKRPAFLSSFSRLQVIQNSAPSTIMRRHCDIRMEKKQADLILFMAMSNLYKLPCLDFRHLKGMYACF